MQGIIVAGTHSGCGKTTVTLGLLSALRRKGLRVQQFKAGPDFIDSGLHRLVTGRPSRNLDLWMCGEFYVKESFRRNSLNADISVAEGVMGLYDGTLSTASLAAALGLPVILVVDAYGLAESAGALVKGFVAYAKGFPPLTPLLDREGMGEVNSGITFAGVIFNRVASENHYKRLKASVADIPVLGCLPRDLDFEIPHRHLGLAVAEENPISDENLRKLSDAVLKHIDVDALIRQEARSKGQEATNERHTDRPSAVVSIAVAYDKAFCFYYEDNLDLLKNEGAEIIRFSPLSDPGIPEGVDAVYIGGGYPELHAKELSQNRSMVRSIHDWAHGDKPLYAECGGLMYLSQGIYDFEGNFFPMAGVYPFETRMKKGRSKLGYREIRLRENCLLGKKGERLRGHEFHYSEIVKDGSKSSISNELKRNSSEDSTLVTCYLLLDSGAQYIQDEGYRFRNTLASYIHVHFGSNPAIAGNFVHFAKEREWNI
jgi:cobyrinic acid a,c-diamide synthase